MSEWLVWAQLEWGRAHSPVPAEVNWSWVMTSKPKYAGWGIALGAMLGAVFGVLAGHMGIWLAIGIVIGMLLGASFRRRQQACPECAALHRVHELRR